MRHIPTDMTQVDFQGADWSPDGTLLACYGPGNLIWLRDPRTGGVVDVLETQHPVNVARWSGSGQWLGVGTNAPDAIAIWSVEGRRLLRSLQGHRALWAVWDGAARRCSIQLWRGVFRNRQDTEVVR